ncbi:MAG: Ku protein [Frankiales bacterium]|nr:Ku protein [Frankiales bacterium]
MRAMWKGSVAFGLVNVPIKLYAATEDHDVRFHQVHAADGGRIKMVRTCSIDGQPVEYKDLAKGYETDSGQLVVMDEADFEGLPVPGVREIEVLEFVPSDQVDPLLFDRSYYLEPESKALKPYVLLREALEQTDRTAIVRVVLRNKSQLAALRVRGDVLVMQTMLWPDEVRAADFGVLEGDVEIREQELAMAASLVDSLASDFDPAQYKDDYREALLKVIEAKVAGGEGVTAPEPASDGDTGDGLVVDLMAALRESVERTKASRAEAQESAPAKPAPRKRAASSSKAPAGSARKSTSKKASEAEPEKAKARRRSA